MTEERICATCKYYGSTGVFCNQTLGCDITNNKWQPIHKAPSFQVTEEEAKSLLLCIYGPSMQNFNSIIKKLNNAGYIRKSPLVELVEEAEKIWAIYYSDSESIPSNINCKLYQALQALKKNHPEFEGKK